ncbi:hypothetical protein HHS34_007240 [Acidithiobacillus montserratensis]|uniref:Uncharacterized protein n=1 Tax=Acidithiobacillus montserratensis TaxID=2729135 RepID=A0ACD5HEB7_9PROT
MAAVLPNLDRAWVPVAKITDYLLSQSHPIGRTKASFFLACGFVPENPQVLMDALIIHAQNRAYSRPSPYGLKYVVEGALNTPAKGSVTVCSVWMIEAGSDVPAFVTAYPIKRAKS